ncbi:aminotransferase class V-fold PLP-dependent enzyme [Kitasatospora sp. NPDC036755]|uniref:aminotransferase class V-fold PLP-dependent enzyme n=1 Tax=Kitasatospora sp. NPDC036755 TaxID=3154600 RepID=UPI0033E2E5AF
MRDHHTPGPDRAQSTGPTRRRLVAGLGGLAVPRAEAGRPPREPPPEPPRAGDRPPGEVAQDEVFWRRVARCYAVSGDFVNLENGYYGIMPEPVRIAHQHNTERLNRLNSRLLRGSYKEEVEQVRARIADLAGVAKEEIALTRCGTEALQNLIGGYNRLRAGDAVMYSDLDYHSAQWAMNWLRERRGVRVVRITMPEPATRDAVLDTYARALDADPGVRLLLLSHLNNRTGLVLPVAPIVAMARRRGVDTVVDAAHSWGQLDFGIPDLGADFAAFSLHKWLNAPLGTGFLYIRRGRLADIDRTFADETHPADDIRSRVHSGTTDVAPMLTVPAAVDFHRAVGGAAVKQARLRHLRDRWVAAARRTGGIEILTPDEEGAYGALTAFRVRGRTSEADNTAIVRHLLDRYRVFTVRRGGPAAGDCVRVTPALYTRAEDVDLLGAALHDVAARFAV